MPGWKTKVLASLPFAAAAVAFSEIFRIAHPPDLPAFPNQDLSGDFGDPALPLLRIVAVGDSSLTAPGITDIDATWIRRSAMVLADRYHVELKSVAVGGSKVRDVTNDQVDAAVALRPDIVMLAAGSNDAIRAIPIWMFEREFRQLLAPLHAAAGAVVVLGVGDLGTIPRLPKWLSAFLRWRGRLLDDAIARVASRYPRTAVVDSGPISARFQEGGAEMFSGDLFHASEAGHAAFVDEVVRAFEMALTMYRRSVGGQEDHISAE